MAGDRRFGVAVDFSKSSKRALSWAIDNLVNKGDTLILIHVKQGELDEAKHALWAQSGSRMLTKIVCFLMIVCCLSSLI